MSTDKYKTQKIFTDEQIEEQSKKLSPCPFCGKIPYIRKSNDIPPCFGIDHHCEPWERRITIELRWKDTPKEVVESWNECFHREQYDDCK